MQAYRSISHTSTFESPNFLMLSRETQVLDHLTYDIPDHDNSVHECGGVGRTHESRTQNAFKEAMAGTERGL